MDQRWWLSPWAVMALTAAILSGLLLWVWQSNRLAISPTQQRSQGVSPITTAPVYDRAAAPEWFQTITVTEDDTRVAATGKYQSAPQQPGEPVPVVRFRGTETGRFPHGGTVALDWLGVFLVGKQQIELHERMRAGEWNLREQLGTHHYYDANLTPLPEERVAELARLDTGLVTNLIWNGLFSPGLHLGFDIHGFENFQMRSFTVRDARTGRPLGGFYTNPRGEPLHIHTVAHMLHDAPIEIDVEFAHGPVETARFPTGELPHLHFQHAEVRILSVFEQGGSSSFGGSSVGEWQVSHDKATQPNPHPSTTLIVAVFPKEMVRNLSIHTIKETGEELTGYFSGSSDGAAAAFSISGVKPADIEELEIRIRPSIGRFISRIDRIPGLPEKNRRIRNLLHVQVPYVRFTESYRFEQHLSGWLQLHVGSTMTPAFPPNYFPVEFENVTVGQLLDEYRSHLPPHRIIVNYEQGQLRFDTPTSGHESVFSRAIKRLIGE